MTSSLADTVTELASRFSWQLRMFNRTLLAAAAALLALPPTPATAQSPLPTRCESEPIYALVTPLAEEAQLTLLPAHRGSRMAAVPELLAEGV